MGSRTREWHSIALRFRVDGSYGISSSIGTSEIRVCFARTTRSLHWNTSRMYSHVETSRPESCSAVKAPLNEAETLRGFGLIAECHARSRA
jgi:hypothetical protein